MDYDSRRDLLELARAICYLNSHTFKHKVALVSLKNIDYDYATNIDEKQTKKTQDISPACCGRFGKAGYVLSR